MTHPSASGAGESAPLDAAAVSWTPTALTEALARHIVPDLPAALYTLQRDPASGRLHARLENTDPGLWTSRESTLDTLLGLGVGLSRHLWMLEQTAGYVLLRPDAGSGRLGWATDRRGSLHAITSHPDTAPLPAVTTVASTTDPIARAVAALGLTAAGHHPMARQVVTTSRPSALLLSSDPQVVADARDAARHASLQLREDTTGTPDPGQWMDAPVVMAALDTAPRLTTLPWRPRVLLLITGGRRNRRAIALSAALGAESIVLGSAGGQQLAARLATYRA